MIYDCEKTKFKSKDPLIYVPPKLPVSKRNTSTQERKFHLSIQDIFGHTLFKVQFSLLTNY